jgi:hypothetical protein
LAKAHIYVKEFLTIVFMVEYVNVAGVRNTKFLVLCDNTPVVYAVQRGYSTSVAGREMLLRLSRVLKKAGCEIELISIRSEDNYADIYTRPQRRAKREVRRKRLAATTATFRHGKIGLERSRLQKSLSPTDAESKDVDLESVEPFLRRCRSDIDDTEYPLGPALQGISTDCCLLRPDEASERKKKNGRAPTIVRVLLSER